MQKDVKRYKNMQKDAKKCKKMQKDTKKIPKSKLLLKALQLGIEPRSPAHLSSCKKMTSRNTNHYTTEDEI